MGLFFKTAILLGTAALAALAGPAAAQAAPQQPVVPQEQPEPIIADEEFARETRALDFEAGDPARDWEQQAADDGSSAELAQTPSEPGLVQAPLPPIGTFDVVPASARPTDAGLDDPPDTAVAYNWRLEGPSGDSAQVIRSRFNELSQLREGGGKAPNRSVIAARVDQDLELLRNLLASEGYFDGQAEYTVVSPDDPSSRLGVTITADAGPRFVLAQIAFDAPPVEPPDLIKRNFVPKSGDPIVAEVILAAEANIALALPRHGYPFASVGQRDILLDSADQTGDYMLPVSPGPRSYFGTITTQGAAAFDAAHIAVLSRFERGGLYDSRQIDDLRDALVATGLLATVSVEPVASVQSAPDGTPYADLLVRQEAGPPRTLSASLGYATGQGLRIEGGWTHRNLFPPEGALIATAVAGTQEQGLSATFRRANAGQRDRTVELTAGFSHSDFAAFEAFTGRLAGRISRDSTPIWQKTLTYGFGFEAIATREQFFDPQSNQLLWRNYGIAALPLELGLDQSDDLLDPKSGFRVNFKLSPEASLNGGSHVYARSIIEATGYVSAGDDLVFAGRARAGAIAGIDQADIAPSRRYYGGGGGSVRGFGYQQLGPRDINNVPTGGRSLNEAAIEARYRFGNYGIVGFVDAGQVYETSLPKFSDWRFGAGLGARFYTNFGPLRLDIATPLKRQTGESRISVYISIGQAF